MKTMIAALLALTLNVGVAHAALDIIQPESDAAGHLIAKDTSGNEVVIPAEVTQATEEAVNHIRTLQAAELVWLDAQQKYYEILRASFEGSRALSTAFEKAEFKNHNNRQTSQTGVSTVSGTVMIAMDAVLAKLWLSGATPTAIAIKDIIMAGRGDVSRMSSLGGKTWASLMRLGADLRIPKNYVTTAGLGVFAYIQYENFFVINMSESQYKEVLRSLDLKIATLKKQQAQIADTYVPLSAR